MACLAQKETTRGIRTGTWRATLNLQGQSLPFNFELAQRPEGYVAYLINGDERIPLEEITLFGDSVDIVLHVFDASIRAKILHDTLRGEFIKNYATGYRIPFLAVHGQSHRFEDSASPATAPDFSGKYAVVFTDATDTSPAVGIFEQDGTTLTGTFLTPTGDYRYLQGSVATDGTLQLSTFDGNHAYLFRAWMLPDESLKGEYYSGKTLHQTWTAYKNENAALPDAEKLTYLKAGYDRITFRFPDVTGREVSLDDPKFQDKVIIIQLFGTWCPNCLDETKFLSSWYAANKHRGVEIIGLAYERKDDFDYARDRVLRVIRKFDLPYDVLVAGTDDKTEASKTLPMLNQVIAFPTTIFIGKDGRVKKIHTGFSGPGTGVYFEQFVQHFNETVSELLNEDPDSL
jgi:thiol-disulfide isomerase/thioredoxin